MIEHLQQHHRFQKFFVGELFEVKLFVRLHDDEPREPIKVEFLPENLIEKIKEFRMSHQRKGLETLLYDDGDLEFEISHNQYYEQLALQESVIFTRSIDTDEYLTILLQSLTIDQLKQICREKEIKGYSNYRKDGLITFIILNLDDYEKHRFLIANELKIINSEIKEAVRIILNKSKEKLTDIQIDEARKEIELRFESPHWKTTNFAEFQNGSLSNPPRDCDCRVGSANGFCAHFWIAFFLAIQKNFFFLREWHVTNLPSNLSKIISKLSITPGEE
jgi:hypothetical protein